MTRLLPGSTRHPDENVARSARASEPSSTWWLGVSVIVAIGLAVRLAYAVEVRDRAAGWSDSLYYYGQGLLLADGKGYIEPLQFDFFGKVVESAYHPPLYSTFLGLVSWLGASSRHDNRVATCVLGTATIVVIALVARRLAGSRAGLLAAGLAALYPALWVNDALLMAETMSALTVALTLLAAYRFRASPQIASAAVLGGAIGLATLSRSETILLYPLVAVPFALAPRDATLRRRGALLAAATVALLVIIGPWVGHNLTRFEHPELLTTGTGRTLQAASCDAAFSGPFLGYFAGCPQPVARGDESVGDATSRRSALRYLRAHATRLPVVVAARIGRVWGVYKPGQTVQLEAEAESRGITAARLSLGGYYLAVPFAVGGLVVLRRRRVSILPLISLAVIVMLAVAFTFGLQRYRVTADVAIVVAAAVGLDAMVSWAWQRRLEAAEGRRLHREERDPTLTVQTSGNHPSPTG